LRPGAIDTHAHVFTSALPIVPGARYRPSGDARPDQFLRLLDSHGIAAGLLVQPSFLGTDNEYMLQAIAAAPDRWRGVAVIAPDTDVATLLELHRRGVIGIRLNLLGAPPPALRHEPWRACLKRVATLGLFVEVHAEGEQWQAVLPPLLEAGVRIVIDHIGRPGSNDAASCPGWATVLRVVGEPSVWVKLSAPYRFKAHAGRAVRHLLDLAGPDRVVWGSDWPFTQHPEISSYSLTQRWLAEWIPNEETRRAILSDNPVRLLRAD
jgi:predicted TIM-barrel fold metal-dependent hydrolase